MIHARPVTEREQLPFESPRCYCSTTREGIKIVTKACRELTEAQERLDAFNALPFKEQMQQIIDKTRSALLNQTEQVTHTAR